MKKLYLLLFALMTIVSSAKAWDNTVNGHEFVDLGLPSGTLWATCNVGANSPEEYGDGFAWGETHQKDYTQWSSYTYCNGSSNTLTKYCQYSEYGYNGFTDNLVELLPEDDAATVNWGEGWQMPSLDQLRELNNDDYTVKGLANWNGVQGTLITSRINANQIFLPFGGWFPGPNRNQQGDVGIFWSRTLYTLDPYPFNSIQLIVDSDSYRVTLGLRCDGASVRPVCSSLPVEAYAVFTENDGTLTFYFDNQRTSRPGVSYPIYRNEDFMTFPSWHEKKQDVVKVVFDASFANVRPNTTRYWFYYMTNLQSIEGLTYLNTSEVTDMSTMFGSCRKLTSIDVSGFNTSKVTNMTGMFSCCEGLTSLDVSNFNTSRVTDMSNMFYLSNNITNLDVSSFNTPNVTDMQYMFAECRGLTSLDLSSFNTSNVTNMKQMFYTCPELKTIYVSRRWNTNKVTTSDGMFSYCVRLVGGAGTTYSMSHVNVDYAHIDGGTSNPGYFTYKSVLSYNFEYNGVYYNDASYGTVEVTYEDEDYGTYSGTVVIPETVEYDGWWYTVAGIGERAFYRCPYLTSVTIPATVDIIHNEAFVDAFLDASNSSITCLATTPPTVSPSAFDSAIEEMTLYVLPGCKSAYEAAPYWKNFGTIVELPYSFVKNGIYYKITGEGTVSVSYKEYGCYSGDVVIPETVTYDGVTYTVTKIDNLAFFNCSALTSVSMPETVTAIGNRTFKGCTSLTSITIPNSVTSIGVSAFENCTGLTEVTLGSGLQSMSSDSFKGCTGLQTGNITCLATEPPTIQSSTFADQYQGASLYVPNGCYDAYANAPYWKNFCDIYELPSPIVVEEFTGTVYQEVTASGQQQSSTEASKTVTLTSSADNPGMVDVTFPALKVAGSAEKLQSFTIKDVCAFTSNGATVLMLPQATSMRLKIGKSQNLLVSVMLEGAKSNTNQLVLKLTMRSQVQTTPTEYIIWFGSDGMTLSQIKTVMNAVDDIITGVDGVETETKSDVIYDLSGRKIEKITQPGIYIKNGKKVAVK